MSMHKIKSSVRSLLCIPHPDLVDEAPTDPLAQDVESTVATYLRKALDKYNIATNIHVSILLSKWVTIRVLVQDYVNIL